MHNPINSLSKAVVGLVVETPIALVTDAVTLGGVLTERKETYTCSALKGVMKNIHKATK